MVTLVETQTIEDMIQIIMGAGFSRFPVFNENQDKVVGILMVKDLFVCYKSDHCLLSDVIRPAVFVPESKQLSELLKSFRRDRYHMALVVDEYGMLSGLITIEDILEQIVGDIEDEFFASPKDASIKKLENNKFMIKAATTIIDFNKYFDTNIDSHEYQTVGGLILQELGHMPRRGEQAVIKNFRFTVSRSDSKKIRLIEVENV
jgi:magnesium and cobalt transporter